MAGCTSDVDGSARRGWAAGGDMGRRLASLFVLLGAILGFGFALAAGAAAHATVVSSNPVDGSRLKSAPSAVTITFDEPVGVGGSGYLHVIDEQGKRVDSARAFHPGGDGSRVTDPLTSGLGDGTYTASYRVVSADSHPVAGTLRFVVGNGVLKAAAVDASAVNPRTSVVFGIARWISFAGLALLGGAWLLLSVWRPGCHDHRARATVWTGCGVTAFGAVAELLVQGPYVAGIRPDLGKWSLLDSTLHSAYGQFHVVRLLLVGGLAFVLWIALRPDRRSVRADRVALALGLGIVLTFSATGHGNTTNPRLFSITADLLHITAMAAWLGGLIMLVVAVLPRREPAELSAVLPVFSRVAFACVAVLVATGTYAAWRGIGTVQAVFSTTYGLLVLTKVALLLGMLVLGNLSRRVIQHRYARVPVAYAMSDATGLDERGAGLEIDEPPRGGGLRPNEAERMRRSVLVEIVLALCILVATAVLVAEPRGKEAIATREQRPVSASTQLGDSRTVSVTITPGRHGIVAAEVLVSSPGLEPKRIVATATLPAKQLGPIPLALVADGVNGYAASGINLPVAGDWVINFTVTTSEFDATTAQVTLHLY
jgi:copper transport protein